VGIPEQDAERGGEERERHHREKVTGLCVRSLVFKEGKPV